MTLPWYAMDWARWDEPRRWRRYFNRAALAVGRVVFLLLLVPFMSERGPRG